MCPKILHIFIILFVKVSLCSKTGVNVTTKEIEDGKSSLVFVFDTTGSMYNDLEQLRDGAEMILKTALEEGNIIGDFVFVPFHDPAVGPATVTQDKEVFKSALGMVRVYGGGDCPEKSLGGIQLALDVSAARSYVYVFTDATAGDHRLVGKVLDAVQRKQSQVVFVLTGHCNDLDKPSFKVYQQIASASSGQVFNLNKTSVHKVLDFVKSSIKGRMVNLGSSVNPAGSNYTQGIPVDSTLGEVTVSVSGAKPQITVVDPSGEQLTGPPKLITTLDLSEIMVVKVMQPEPGNWTITVGSEEAYSVKVSGLSNLTFNHGFSVEKPQTMAETSYRPLQGTYNHMMIGLTQKDPPVTIEFAEILSMNGSTLFELPITEVDSENKVYLAEAFIPPEDFFYIAINGKDERSQPLRRMGTTAVQAKVPDVPYLTTSRKITAHVHSRVVLKCKVESLVPVIAMWTKGSHKLQPQISSLQTTTIEFVIEDVQEENVGTYKCFAKNVAGVSKLVTELTVTVDPPQVSIEPANRTLQIGENVTVTCTVFSEALLLEFRFISNLPDETGVTIDVDPNIDGIYSYNITVQNATESEPRTYTCIAANKGGSSNQSTTISVQSKPTARILSPHTLAASLHTTARIVCQVENSNVVKWVHNDTVLKERDVGGMSTDVLELNVTEDGVWMCVAGRGGHEASDSVVVTVLLKPSVTIAGDKNITILNGTRHQLVCEVVAKPQPRISWLKDTDEALNHSITKATPNTYTSTLTLDSSVDNVEGTYFCHGENSEGTTQDHVQVNVRRKITVVKGLKETSEELYHQVELTCVLDSHPPALITWRHNSTLLHSTENILLADDNSSVSIKRVDFDDLGMYSCEADNGFERVELNGTLSVHGLESPVIEKEPAKMIANKGESTLISCRILKGNPSPTITWQYKSGTAASFAAIPHYSAELSIDVSEEKQGVYRCAALNVLGQDSHDVELIVHYPPQLKSKDSHDIDNALAVEAGGSASMACEATGAPLPIVLWTKDGLPMKLSNNILLTKDGLTIDKVTEYDTGSYICNATSSLGSAQRNYTLLVYVAPKITTKVPTDETPLEILEGQLVELPCEAKGSPKPVVSWELNGLQITDERKFVDEFGLRFVANLTDFGNYTCTVKNQYGNTSITYSVYIWVPPSIQPPLETTKDVLVGDDINLQCDVIGFPIPSVLWVFEEQMLKENTTEISFNDVGNLYIRNATSKHEGSYVCVAENLAGIANKFIHLNINESPTILEDNYAGPYLATNLDTALTIACRATGKPKPYIAWSKDDVYLHKDSQYEVGRDGTLTIRSPSEDMSGNYTCAATNKFGIANKTIAVEVYSLPTPQQADESRGAATVLARGGATVACPVRAASGDTLKWYKDAELISTGPLHLSNISRDHQATYACVVSNAVGSAYSTVNVNVEWPPSFVDSDKDETDDKVDDITDRIVESNNEIVDLNEDGTKNVGRTIVHDRNDLDDETTSVGNTGANVDGTKNVDGQDVTGPKYVDEKKSRDKNNGIKIVEVVKGDDAFLDCSTDAKPVAKIKWLHNSKPIVFEDKHFMKLMNVQPHNAGTYKCVANNAHGTIHRLFQLNVSVPPFISDFDVMDVSLMEGVNATLECNAKGYPQPTIHWTYNNTNWNLTNSTLTATKVSSASAGVYRCDATNRAGATHIAYRVGVVSRARVQEVVAFTDGEGITVDKSFEAAVGAHIRIACKSSGAPTPSIQWLRNGKLLSENSQYIRYADLILDVETSHAGRYSCVVANEGGSEERAVRLEVLEPPKIFQSIFQNDPTLEVLSGQAYYLHCHPLGYPTPAVYWFKDGLPLKLFDDSMVSMDYGEVIAVASATDDQSGNYTCVARNRVGNKSVSYQVHVLVPPPQPKESSKAVNLRAGNPLTLTCPLEGSPLPSVMWIKHPYTEIGEATPRITLSDDNITLLINHTLVSDSGNYSCIMTNKAGTTELIYSVSIDKPPSIAGNVGGNGVENHVVPLRRSIVLKCEADGHPLPRISWLKDTQTLSNSSWNVHRVLGNSLLAVWSVTSRDAGQYICVVENGAGTAHRRYNVAVQVPGKWSVWSSWTLCNATCGLGQQKRARACHYIDDNNNVIDKTSKPDKIVVDESACKGPSNERRKCQMPPCEEAGSGVWLAWSRWSACSAACGRGTQARTRKCTDRRCVGDNVQIRKCLDLPKCSNEDNSESDAYSTEGSKENGYMPQAVFEKQPEIVISVSSPDVEEFYTAAAGGSPSQVTYDVNVTHNLDGSDAGACGAGYTSLAGDSCEDIDECVLSNNHCHSTQVCENTQGAYRCTCPRGYVSLGAGQRCMDINECSQESSRCEYACVNTAGGYVCACPAHMRLHADKHHCYTVSSATHRPSYEELDTSEYLSTSVEYPARYKHTNV